MAKILKLMREESKTQFSHTFPFLTDFEEGNIVHFDDIYIINKCSAMNFEHLLRFSFFVSFFRNVLFSRSYHC